MARREETTTLAFRNGTVYEVSVLDGIGIEDVLLQGMKMAAYKLVTGQDKFLMPGRDVRDFIVMTDVLGD